METKTAYFVAQRAAVGNSLNPIEEREGAFFDTYREASDWMLEYAADDLLGMGDPDIDEDDEDTIRDHAQQKYDIFSCELELDANTLEWLPTKESAS